MNESTWLRGKEPQAMLTAVLGKASDRKLRLFMCALARRAWLVLSPEGRDAVLMAERLADGKCDEAERQAAYEAAGGDWSALFTQADCIPAKALMQDHLDYYARDAAAAVTLVADEEGRFIPQVPRKVAAAEHVAQCHLLRDLFGNPFRPVAVEPAWRRHDVTGLAHEIYEDRIYELMPILADALQDAGCADAAILDHCRAAGGHARGCWVVDLLLGKA